MMKIELSQERFALVDDRHYPRLNVFKWSFHKNGRACRTYRNGFARTIWMHHQVLDLYPEEMPSEYEIDHIDRNPLNNQEHNLRVVTHAVNMQNSTKVVNAKGYSFDKKNRNYICYTPSSNSGKNGYLGRVKTEEEAISLVRQFQELILLECLSGD